ncbi:hypothetical protein [Hoeflea sp.]|uniref:hypothetical protein n=1 Tax=Hoeflea sp. TaxID=1940281 RepID=UPI003B01E07B
MNLIKHRLCCFLKVMCLVGPFVTFQTVAVHPTSSEIVSVNACSPRVPEGHGNATTESKAKRNARINLERNLERSFPGDSKRYLRSGIEYDCEKSVLWLCKATAKICG